MDTLGIEIQHVCSQQLIDLWFVETEIWIKRKNAFNKRCSRDARGVGFGLLTTPISSKGKNSGMKDLQKGFATEEPSLSRPTIEFEKGGYPR